MVARRPTADDFEAIVKDVRCHGIVRRTLRGMDLDYRSFYAYVNDTEGAREILDKARVDGLVAMADEMMELADQARRLVKRERTKNKDGTTTTRVAIEDGVERTKLQIHTRMWLMARLLPSVYGEKLSVDQTIRQAEAKQIEQALNDGRKRLALVR